MRSSLFNQGQDLLRNYNKHVPNDYHNALGYTKIACQTRCVLNKLHLDLNSIRPAVADSVEMVPSRHSTLVKFGLNFIMGVMARGLGIHGTRSIGEFTTAYHARWRGLVPNCVCL